MGQPQKTPAGGSKLDAAGLAQWIDFEIQKKLDAEKVRASGPADDAEFLRRVYLDIIGVIPPADKAAAFLDSKEPDKRARLIDELLANPQYGRHMADLWHRMLVERTSDNRRVQVQPLTNWLEKAFNENKPWDKMVTEILTATGEQDKNGAVTFFVANQSIDKVNDTAAKLFLGIQLQCAQCHNHPFTNWKQTEYWGMAAFFSKVKLAGADNKAAKKGIVPSVVESTGKGKGLKLPPESSKKVAPKFLAGAEPRLNGNDPYRPVLAKWMASAENPFFAKAMTNRMWAHLFGRGIVNPIDDMHDGNIPSHPEMLQAVARQFAANNFDIKYLIRAICNSQTYQRSSKPHAGNGDDDKLFSHMAVKVMSPEQLFDSLGAVLGRNDAARPARRGPAGRGALSPREAFLAFFRTDDGDPTEYTAGIPQALRMMNSPQMNGRSPLLNQLGKDGSGPAQNIERLYLATLARRPSAAETQRLVAHVEKNNGDAAKAYSDILWALLNSSEFTVNH
jgi:hypothetical protein